MGFSRTEHAIRMMELADKCGYAHRKFAEYAYGLELCGMFLVAEEAEFLDRRHKALQQKQYIAKEA